MVHKGAIKPTNAISMGNPLVQELQVEVTTNVIPGRHVKKGTADKDIVVGDASGNSVGWVGYEQASPEFKPLNKATAFAATSMAPVMNGGNFYVIARLASGQNVVKGQPLTFAANGEVTAATYGTHHVAAFAEESVNASSAAADILVRSMI
jgi:ribosomal protein S11